MKMNNRLALVAVFAASLFSMPAVAAVPEGSFRGSSPVLTGADVMALIIRRDPADARKGYALLAEYTRVPYIPGPERIELTKWVPRVYAYRVEETATGRFAFKPLRVSAAGSLEVDPGYANFGQLTLARNGRVEGGTLTRYDRGSVMIAETVTFNGRLSSTWEGYVPGDYFGTKDSSGNDYFHSTVNTVLRPDMTAVFTQREVVGTFSIAERAPGLFVFTPQGANVVGADRVASRIGVFIDIVNWKPFFTTDELLLVNPDDARDVGFYYERH